MIGPCPESARKLLSRMRRSLRALLCFAPLVGLGVAPAATADPGQEQVTRDFQKSLSLGAGQWFRIENKFGEVRIHGESGRELKISATIRAQADSREQAQGFADKVRIDVEQTAQGVQVRTNYPEDNRNWFGRKNASYSVDYDIAMPADAPLFVRNSFGSVNATGVRSKSEFDNSHGSLNVRESGATRLSNSFGSIELRGAAGDSTVSDNNGSVQVSQVKGSLEVHNRFGSITVREIQGAANITGGNGAVNLTDAGSANITTSFGSVEARNIRGDLIVRDNNGNVDVSTVGGGADITDSFGNVTFSDVKGRVICTTSNGRVSGSSLSGSAVTIRNSFGNLDLSNIAGALNAETSNGKITLRSAHGMVELRSSFGAIEASDVSKGIRAITGNGSITLTDIGGETFAKTSFGSVSAERISGNLMVENTNGSVSARNVKGDASVTTSFAGVTLESVGGKITVNNQNGGISVAAARPASGCRDIALKTSFSSIRVSIPPGVGYNVTARTSFGRISTDLPITATGSMAPDSLNGTIGSGGCQLQLTDANGSIEITKGQ
ncbi:MAG: hypothetical protein JWO71_259 [Candidatus Acidoferrum typicum]|nr:hypothetical protein [Candidatus Acidoferrum typicum]